MTQSYYETMYILRPDIPEEEVESHVTKYRDLVTESGGQVLDCQMRGKRRLAYPIAKQDGPMPAPRTLPAESNEAPAPVTASAAAATAAPAS